MKRLLGLAAVLVGVAVVVGCGSGGSADRGGVSAQATGTHLALPPAGKMYHSVYPGGKTGEEVIAQADLVSYQAAVGQQAAWVSCTNDWYYSTAFPVATCTWVRNLGSVPYIRLALRSTWNLPEPVYTLAALAAGKFDAGLKSWALAAKAFGTPVIVEYGTEVNGDWEPWNGQYAGAGTLVGTPAKAEGPAEFVAAYRHIVTVMRAAGATNLTWVFHASWDDYPNVAWNHFENYYPGSDVVDWVGISAYGYLTPQDNYPKASIALQAELDAAYPRMVKLAPGKPIMLLEFGCTGGDALQAPQTWAQAALNTLFSNRYPLIRGFAWWNEDYANDSNPAHNTIMRVQELPALATVFKTTLAAHAAQIQTRPVLGP